MAQQLTREQAISQYGEVPLLFESYYKFTFTFCGVAPDGASISIGIGGTSDSIYKTHVLNTSTRVLEDGYHATIRRGGEVVYDYYDCP